MKKLRVTVNGVSYDVDVEIVEDDDVGGASYGYSATTPASPMQQPPSMPSQPRTPSSATPRSAANNKEVTSPIAGVITEVKVAVGSNVKENDLIVIIEAMKMHTNISSPSAGVVKDIRVKSGDAVQQGQILLTFE